MCLLYFVTDDSPAQARTRRLAGVQATLARAGLGGSVDRAANVVGDGVYGQARVSALATRRTSPRWAFTVGPQLSAQRYWADAGGHASGLMLGAFANAAWQFRPRWALVPELALHGTLVGEVPVHGATAQLGVAVARTW